MSTKTGSAVCSIRGEGTSPEVQVARIEQLRLQEKCRSLESSGSDNRRSHSGSNRANPASPVVTPRSNRAKRLLVKSRPSRPAETVPAGNQTRRKRRETMNTENAPKTETSHSTSAVEAFGAAFGQTEFSAAYEKRIDEIRAVPED